MQSILESAKRSEPKVLIVVSLIALVWVLESTFFQEPKPGNFRISRIQKIVRSVSDNPSWEPWCVREFR